MMQAVILAGGSGTRLRPFTMTVPKPLLPLGDRPIIDILLGQLYQGGFRRIHMCLGYMAPLFQAFFGDGSQRGLAINYTIEDRPLGTAGALASIPDLDDDFLVLNGDTLTDISFSRLLGAHVEAGAYGTIFSVKINEIVDYGVIEFEEKSRLLTTYIEKPTRHYHVSTGIYALSRRILDYAQLNEQGKLDMPDLLRRASQCGRPVLCYTPEGAYWRDIGRFDHYEAASKEYEQEPGRFSRGITNP